MDKKYWKCHFFTEQKLDDIMISVEYFNIVWKSYRQPAWNISKTSGKSAKNPVTEVIWGKNSRLAHTIRIIKGKFLMIYWNIMKRNCSIYRLLVYLIFINYY